LDFLYREEEKTGDGLEQEISPKWKGKIRKWSQVFDSVWVYFNLEICQTTLN